MIREAAALGVLVLLLSTASALPDKRPHISPSYGPPPASYGAPAPVEHCYPKHVTKVMTKDVQTTSMAYATVTEAHPTTVYASIVETVVGPHAVTLTSTMTAYAEPRIITKRNVLTDTKMVTEAKYLVTTTYGYNTAQQYFTETTGVYHTTTATQSYPITHTTTETQYTTQGYYITQTILREETIKHTTTKGYYVTHYDTKTQVEYEYHTKTDTVQNYNTMTVWNTVPEYHTVTYCAPKHTAAYGTPRPS